MKVVAALLLLAMTASAIRLQNNPAATTKRVHLLISRHGLSCSNAVAVFHQHEKENMMPDPMLTACGAHRSTFAGEKMKSLGLVPDVVLSSSMLRSMETAHYQYPGMMINPVPFISESTNRHSKALMDIPLTLEEQGNRLFNTYGKDGVKRNMKWMNLFGTDETRRLGSWDNFTHFLAHDFLPGYNGGRLMKKDDLKVAVVTHMGFIKDVPGVQEHCEHYSHLPNNGLLELVFAYNTELEELTLIEETPSMDRATPCIIHKEVSVPLHSSHFCQGDFGPVCDQEVKAAFPGDKKTGIFKTKEHKHTCCVA